MGIPKYLPIYFHQEFKKRKINHNNNRCFGQKGKEDMGIQAKSLLHPTMEITNVSAQKQNNSQNFWSFLVK